MAAYHCIQETHYLHLPQGGRGQQVNYKESITIMVSNSTKNIHINLPPALSLQICLSMKHAYIKVEGSILLDILMHIRNTRCGARMYN